MPRLPTLQTIEIDFILGNMTILWDEAFLDSDGLLKWCSNPKVPVPVPITAGNTSQPFVLVSRPFPPVPILAAEPIDSILETQALCQIPDLLFQQYNC